jgi:hypothetical protein
MTFPFVEPPVKPSTDPALDPELAELRRRVATLEEWVRMVEGSVTGPLSALPTLGEASLRVPR